MELYQFETSVYENEDVGPLGLYPYRYFDHYWTEEGRHPFLVRCDALVEGRLHGLQVQGGIPSWCGAMTSSLALSW